MRYLFILIISGVLFGQDAKTLYLFELEDESEYVGELIADTPDNVTIKRMDGSVVNIPAYKVIKRTKIDESQWDQESGEIIFGNLHDSRYFFSPSAFALEKGEGYSMNAYSIYWAFQYGVADNFSLGAGASFIGLTSLQAKYTVPSNTKDFNFAVGWFWVGFPLLDENKSIINIPFAVSTWGDKEKNISLGFGLNIEADKNPLVLNIGGTNRMSRSTALVFELWGFNYTSYSYNDDVYDEGGWAGTSYNTREKVTNTLIYGGPGVRVLRKKTKKRLFGIFKQNNYAGSNVIDFQIFFSHTDGMTIGPFPMIGASRRF
tara:strand:+ start:1 stop:951 length:951 start_codon:yes stop_codon:yes gene_type:complete